MKKIITAVTALLLIMTFMGCASVSSRDGAREIHPGHIGHEVH